MSYEYVRVSFPSVRRVLIDGDDGGATGDVLRVDRGSHRFALAGTFDYDPPFQERVIAGTNPIAPAEIEFRPKSG